MDIFLGFVEGLAPNISALARQAHKTPTYTAYSTSRDAHDYVEVDDRPPIRPNDTQTLGVARLRAPALLPQTSDT
jgi:hypothetical protein